MKPLKWIVDLFLGKDIEVLQAKGKKQSETIDKIEAHLNGEDEWMLERKSKKDTTKYNCDCTEV